MMQQRSSQSQDGSSFFISFFGDFLGDLWLLPNGQIDLFKHSEHLGPTGRHVCCPKPTIRWLISLHNSLKVENIISKVVVGELKNAPNPIAARAFVSFLVSSEGRAILKKHGYTTELE